MNWDELQREAKKILENEPTGNFIDKAFTTSSGGLPRNEAGIEIVRQSTERRHKTVRYGYAQAAETIVRCRETGAKDGKGRTIYEDVNGVLFTWKYTPGCAAYFDSGAFLSPSLE